MNFAMNISAATAASIINRIEEVAVHAAQQWDCVQYTLPDGNVVSVGRYEGPAEKPVEFISAKGFAMSSRVTVFRNGDQWRLAFEGMRGSLSGHWNIVEMLQKDGGEVEDYKTSIPGMLPWESVYSWFARMTGCQPHELHPFDPVNGGGEAEEFNRRFYNAVQELVRKRKITARYLIGYRNVIVKDIQRKYGWSNVA